MAPPQHKLLNEIYGVTSTIQKEFPELYEHINETPLFLSYHNKGPTQADFERYLDTLKIQLATFEVSRTYPG